MRVAEARGHFLHEALGREVGVHEVAVVEEAGKAPIAAEAGSCMRSSLGSSSAKMVSATARSFGSSISYQRRPLTGKALNLTSLEEGEHLQHLLVVLIVPEGGQVGLEEGQVVGAGELLRELVDVDRLVVVLDLLPLEGSSCR